MSLQGSSKVLRAVEECAEAGRNARPTSANSQRRHEPTQYTDEFRRLLKAENIDTIFRINPVGRIYGVTFIDHNDGIVARRSVLGKEFSANVFNELYPAPKNDKQVPEQHTAP